MHVKDLQSALARAHGFSKRATDAIAVALLKIQEADHALDLATELERGNELENMRAQVQALEQSSTPGLDEAEE